METPRPTVDIDNGFCYVTEAKRKKRLRSKIHFSHDGRRIVRLFRELQVAIIQTNCKCTKKMAISLAEDPTPYSPNHLFYCL